MIKKIILTLAIVLCLAVIVVLAGNTVLNPDPARCSIREIKVARVYEGGVKDLVIAQSNGEFFYINRGLEQGFNLEDMREKVLHKTVTLHLAPILIGTSRHITQLALADEVIYSEFNQVIVSNK